ncbi:hypothetical protein [Sediminibacterium soli]|uniref:hypothetical protein n=1 Tax=Sediminibacterium soli TaxID=2698829 RepID=UPI0013797871|nr:hypothetical protein [Sediminibacterium soli]NCI45475.1 hypothetical protein [Sediminibacterium soli]
MNSPKQKDISVVEEPGIAYGFAHLSEEEKLKKDIFRSDMEKFQLFMQMLRRNALLKKAVISHNK